MGVKPTLTKRGEEDKLGSLMDDLNAPEVNAHMKIRVDDSNTDSFRTVNHRIFLRQPINLKNVTALMGKRREWSTPLSEGTESK